MSAQVVGGSGQLGCHTDVERRWSGSKLRQEKFRLVIGKLTSLSFTKVGWWKFSLKLCGVTRGRSSIWTRCGSVRLAWRQGIGTNDLFGTLSSHLQAKILK